MRRQYVALHLKNDYRTQRPYLRTASSPASSRPPAHGATSDHMPRRPRIHAQGVRRVLRHVPEARQGTVTPFRAPYFALWTWALVCAQSGEARPSPLAPHFVVRSCACGCADLELRDLYMWSTVVCASFTYTAYISQIAQSHNAREICVLASRTDYCEHYMDREARTAKIARRNAAYIDPPWTCLMCMYTAPECSTPRKYVTWSIWASLIHRHAISGTRDDQFMRGCSTSSVGAVLCV